MTIKDLVYKILLENPETRDSDKKLIWEVWDRMNLLEVTNFFYQTITKESFMSAPSNESVRRVRQQLQREDLLLGKNLIQPSKLIKDKRIKLSQEKGASFIMGKQPVYNPDTQTYEI